jgi:hypothetical protein
VSAENVAIVKSSWAGWRQDLREQMVRDFADGLAERVDAWAADAGAPPLQALEFIDGGDEVLVCAAVVGEHKVLWFKYTLDAPRIVDWHVYDDEKKAREAAGVPT